MNLYGHYTDALEKVANRREKHYADALKSHADAGFRAQVPWRTHLSTRADILNDYQSARKYDRSETAVQAAHDMIEDAYDRMGISQAAQTHYGKAQKKSNRKAGSILNRVLPGGAGRKAKNLERAKHYEAQAKAHADNVAKAERQKSVHVAAADAIELPYSFSNRDQRKANQLADAYMKKHFS